MKTTGRLTRRIALVFGLVVLAAGVARAQDVIGTAFPASFPVIEDASLGVPVIGFGAVGSATRTPVIFLHGNGGTPYDTSCGMWPTLIRSMAQYFANAGYSGSELWALGYQGTQCDLIDHPVNNSSLAHTNTANVPDLRRFVNAVLVSTGARKVDIVAHGMGVTLVREWVRQYGAQNLVRRFVAIEGPNSGMITCSPSPSNYWQLAFLGGFSPTSPVCQELGSPNTLFLKVLNKAGNRIDPKNTLVIRNGDASFLFLPVQDGGFAPVPAMDSFGKPIDFSKSPRIGRATELVVTAQGAYDVFQGTAHIGIANSPQTWQAALSYLTRP
ncbi:MAG: lipase family protein [Gammaproteobacteria bacterium]|nr:lipase family protein [Gammaproteobacteria bacterium]MDH4311052.1 lipase family protein [Gammaproteobacteria bacterium]MDH5274051.1 lipase family protein [Gammaproteobacteria bacterium]